MYRFIISIILWPIWFLFFLSTIILFHIAIFIIPLKHFHYLVRPICGLYCILAGQWLRKENLPPDTSGQPYIYMFNHQSMLDQFMIAAFIPHYLTAVGAVEQFRYPIWGSLMKKYGVIPIVRQELKKAIHTLAKAEEVIQNGISFIISPEGTRSLTGELGAFKKGPFHLAKNTDATIVPVGLIGAFKAKKKKDWRLTPGVLITKFGKPIKANEFRDLSVEEIRDMVRDRIKTLIKQS